MPALHSPPGSWSGRLATRRAATCSSARTTPVSIPRRVMSSAASAFVSASDQLAERVAMERALELARRGWGRVAPNPLVGAVVLQGGKVVGEGYHAEYGGPHAEVVALEAAGRGEGEGARGATLVVNLEPCAHHGKTPPCTDAIVAAGIGRVVAAIRDPDPLARGGAGVLRSHSVVVSLGLLADAAAALNAPFLFAREQAERPFVALKLATSIDGRIADAAGSSRWVSGDAAREYVHWLRAGFDAIAVGGTTALRDNPQLTVRGNVTPRKTPVRGVTLPRTVSCGLSRRAVVPPTAIASNPARSQCTYSRAASPDTQRELPAASAMRPSIDVASLSATNGRSACSRANRNGALSAAASTTAPPRGGPAPRPPAPGAGRKPKRNPRPPKTWPALGSKPE